MNKPLLTGAGVTLVALGVTPYFIGTSVHENVNAAVSEINQQAVYSAEVLSYDKGWFSTTAEIKLAVDFQALINAQNFDPADIPMEENPGVTATLVAHHGPVYFGDGLGLGRVHYTVSIDGDELREYVQWDGQQPIYRNEGVVGLFGGLNYADVIPALSATSEEEGFTLLFSGYTGEAEPDGDHTLYTSSGESLSISADEFSMEMKNLSMDLSYEGNLLAAVKGDVFESEVKALVESMKITGVSVGETVQMENIALITDTDVNEGTNTANIYVEYAIDNLVGPEFEATNMVLGVAINNLDIKFINAYQDFSNTSLLTPAEEVPAKMMEFIEANLLSQLKAEPELNITKLKATLPEGSFNAHANTKLVGINALPSTMEDVAYWVTHLLADAQITADKAFAQNMASGYMMSQLMATPQAQNMTPEELQAAVEQQTPMMLSTFAQQGLIKETEKGYETKLELKDGKASVNGTPIPLPFAPQ
ncbi:YdgA family protein [Alteromonas sp. S015]|uniref:YdgA family protein n=1 Tax=Alteromonas sp. S015 TaxID=3117401 RepID=UPI002FE2E7DA